MAVSDDESCIRIPDI